MMRPAARSIVLMLFIFGLPGTVLPATVVDEVKDAVFSEVERQILERYFDVPADESDETTSGSGSESGKSAKKNKPKGKKKGLPPGLAKKDKLPPGLAKREVLPPGLARRSLPDDVEHQLPPANPGTERTIVENRVVLIETATGKVLDILENIVLGP